MPRKDYALTPQQRNDAREALEILAPLGITLAEAARRASSGIAACERITLGVGIDRFLRSRLSLRSQTASWYESKLKVFADSDLAAKLADNVSRADVRALIASRPVSDATRAAYARAVRACYSWLRAQEPSLAATDPTEGLKVTASRSGDVGFLTIKQVNAVLAAAGKHRSAIALMLFAGVRPDEVCGRGKPPILWENIDPVGKTITVPAGAAKGGVRRTIEGLPDSVWAWLGEPKGEKVPISETLGYEARIRVAKLSGVKPWPHDALRHTFATYAMAYTANAPQVSVWLGHEGNPTMLHRHYRGLATKAQAEAFFALRPPEWKSAMARVLATIKARPTCK